MSNACCSHQRSNDATILKDCVTLETNKQKRASLQDRKAPEPTAIIKQERGDPTDME